MWWHLFPNGPYNQFFDFSDRSNAEGDSIDSEIHRSSTRGISIDRQPQQQIDRQSQKDIDRRSYTNKPRKASTKGEIRYVWYKQPWRDDLSWHIRHTCEPSVQTWMSWRHIAEDREYNCNNERQIAQRRRSNVRLHWYMVQQEQKRDGNLLPSKYLLSTLLAKSPPKSS